MDDISIGSLTFKLEELSLNNVNALPKSFILEGREYFFDHDKKPKMDTIEQILNVNDLKDTGCRNPRGVCNNLECLHCYNKSLLGHPKGIYYSSKNEKHPRYLPLGSNKKVLMNCDRCLHDFKMDPSHLREGNWCPYCARKKLCLSMECYDCYLKSFVSSKRLPMWSSKNKISPRLIFRRSGKECILHCKICDHEFIRSLSVENSCPYCASKKLCSSDCQFCFSVSFASIEYSKNWSPENMITPREIFKYSDTWKFKFICPDCNHTFETLPKTISKGDACSYCASKYLCDNSSCIICFNKSLASYYDIKYFSPKNNINPRMIFKGSDTAKYIFSCENCKEEYLMTPYHFSLRGQRCTCVINKTERKLYNYLKNFYNIKREKNFDWCINPLTNKDLPFDFYLPDHNILIELDGIQHFKQIMDWQDPNITRNRDIYKMVEAFKHEFTIIRIFQEDVFHDRNDWHNKLISCIKKYDKNKIIFIEAVEEVYSQHIQDLKDNNVDSIEIMRNINYNLTLSLLI